MTHLLDALLYLSLLTIDFLAGILIVAIPVVVGAFIVSGLWYIICTAYEKITGSTMKNKDWVLGTIWASAMSMILYRATRGRGRGKRRY